MPIMKRLFQRFEMNEFADKIEAIDVGIDEFGCCDSPTSDASRGLLCGQSFSEITYIHIHECEDVSVTVSEKIYNVVPL
jgi:hypothetical protein